MAVKYVALPYLSCGSNAGDTVTEPESYMSVLPESFWYILIWYAVIGVSPLTCQDTFKPCVTSTVPAPMPENVEGYMLEG